MNRLPRAILIGMGAFTPTLSTHAQQPADAGRTAPITVAEPSAVADSAAASTSTASAAPAAAPATPPVAAPAGPSADTVKKAHQAGYHKETRNGATVFCREDANLGTRFTTKKCIKEDDLASVLDRQQEEHREFSKSSACSGAGCGAGH